MTYWADEDYDALLAISSQSSNQDTARQASRRLWLAYLFTVIKGGFFYNPRVLERIPEFGGLPNSQSKTRSLAGPKTTMAAIHNSSLDTMSRIGDYHLLLTGPAI